MQKQDPGQHQKFPGLLMVKQRCLAICLQNLQTI